MHMEVIRAKQEVQPLSINYVLVDGNDNLLGLLKDPLIIPFRVHVGEALSNAVMKPEEHRQNHQKGRVVIASSVTHVAAAGNRDGLGVVHVQRRWRIHPVPCIMKGSQSA